MRVGRVNNYASSFRIFLKNIRFISRIQRRPANEVSLGRKSCNTRMYCVTQSLLYDKIEGYGNYTQG